MRATLLMTNDACALLAALQETLGEAMVKKLASEDWFCDLDICREFKREAAQLLAGLEVDGNDLGLATLTDVGVLPKVVFRLTDLARDQARRDRVFCCDHSQRSRHSFRS